MRGVCTCCGEEVTVLVELELKIYDRGAHYEVPVRAVGRPGSLEVCVPCRDLMQDAWVRAGGGRG